MANKQFSGIAAAIGAIFFWGSSFPAIKIALESYSPLVVAASRFVVASLFFLVIACVKETKCPRLKDLPLFILLAFVGVFAYQWLLSYGESLTSAGTAGFVVNIAPLFTIFIAYFIFGESLSFFKITGVLVSLLGVYMIAVFGGASLSLNVGLIALILGAFCWSLFFILQKSLLKKYSVMDVTCITIFIATILFFFVLTPRDMVLAVKQGSLSSQLALLYLGLFSTSMAYALWAYTLDKYPVSKAATYTYLVPFVSAVLSHLFLEERYSDGFMAGAVLIMVGVVLSNVKRAKKELVAQGTTKAVIPKRFLRGISREKLDP